MPFAFAPRIHADRRKTTGAMEVQIRVQLCGVELLQSFGVLARNVAVADVFADDRAVLAFLAPSQEGMVTLSSDKVTLAASLLVSVVGGAVGAAFGELHP